MTTFLSVLGIHQPYTAVDLGYFMTLFSLGIVLPTYWLGYRRGWVRDHSVYAVTIVAKRMMFAIAGMLLLISATLLSGGAGLVFVQGALPLMLLVVVLWQIGYRPGVALAIMGGAEQSKSRIPLYFTALNIAFWWAFVFLIAMSQST